jgi:trehalose/maltose hydrolase-like predicted phosphorylase
MMRLLSSGRYWRATGDDDFMVEAGGDILIETARFWASRARMEADGHAHIRAILGKPYQAFF